MTCLCYDVLDKEIYFEHYTLVYLCTSLNSDLFMRSRVMVSDSTHFWSDFSTVVGLIYHLTIQFSLS